MAKVWAFGRRGSLSLRERGDLPYDGLAFMADRRSAV